MYTPIYTALGWILLFLLKGKRTRRTCSKVSLRQKFTLSFWNSWERFWEWSVPRLPGSMERDRERLSKNKLNHMATGAEGNKPFFKMMPVCLQHKTVHSCGIFIVASLHHHDMKHVAKEHHRLHSNNSSGIYMTQSKPATQPRTEPQKLKIAFRISGIIAFRAKMETGIWVVQTTRSVLLFKQTHVQFTVTEPCSVRHICRERPLVPLWGLLKHAAESRLCHTHTRRHTRQYIKPHICLHDIRSHKSLQVHSGSFDWGKGEMRSEARCLSFMRH